MTTERFFRLRMNNAVGPGVNYGRYGVLQMRLLVVYSKVSSFTQLYMSTTMRSKVSRNCAVSSCHPWRGGDVNLAEYDAVFVSYCARLCIEAYVSPEFLEKLRAFRGVIGIAIQDEYDFVENERRALELIRPDVVFTCVPSEQRELIYPKARFHDVRFERVLTGYQPDIETSVDRKPIFSRNTTLGYRGRPLSGRYGKLGEQKSEIGTFFLDQCKMRGIKSVDISITEEGRIYREDWYSWLEDCKCVLGVPSGRMF